MHFQFLVVLLSTAISLDAYSSGVLTDNGGQPRSRPDQPVQQNVRDMTVNCGNGKTCFGSPTGCIEKNNCQILTTVVDLGTGEYLFELFAKKSQTTTYVAIGLSTDRLMGDDSVVHCVDEDGTVKHYTSWNLNTSPLTNIVMPMSGVTLLSGAVINGDIHCQFTRLNFTTHFGGSTYDLDIIPYFLMIARGEGYSGGNITEHDLREVSSEAVLLSDGGTILAQSKVVLRLHAAFMITAWIGAASIGIFLARYYKQTFVGSKMGGKDQWFVWHRVCMVTTWSLTMAAFIMIFIEINGWSSANNPHAILGTCTTILAFVQPFMAALRPAPTSPNRPVFKWIHLLVGNAAHIMGIVTIFFATKLAKAEVPSWLDWILFSYVIFHVLMHVTMSILGFLSEKISIVQESELTPKDFGSRRSSTKSLAPRIMDAPHSTVRKVLLGVYIVVVVLLTVAIVVIAVMAPIEASNQKLKL